MFFYPWVRMNASLTSSSIGVISTFTILQLQARATSLDHLLYARYHVKITFAQRFENTRQLRRVLNWLVMN